MFCIQWLSLALPRNLLRMSVLRPFLVLLRARNPCLRLRMRCEGWYSDPYVTHLVCAADAATAGVCAATSASTLGGAVSGVRGASLASSGEYVVVFARKAGVRIGAASVRVVGATVGRRTSARNGEMRGMSSVRRRGEMVVRRPSEHGADRKSCEPTCLSHVTSAI